MSQHTLQTINYCLSIFKIVKLFHAYVLSYVHILNYLLDTYYMERQIIAQVDRSVLISALSRTHLALPGTLTATNDCYNVL